MLNNYIMDWVYNSISSVYSKYQGDIYNFKDWAYKNKHEFNYEDIKLASKFHVNGIGNLLGGITNEDK